MFCSHFRATQGLPLQGGLPVLQLAPSQAAAGEQRPKRGEQVDAAVLEARVLILLRARGVSRAKLPERAELHHADADMQGMHERSASPGLPCCKGVERGLGERAREAASGQEEEEEEEAPVVALWGFTIGIIGMME